uniref:BING4 C-terminal domain-containing protein n=1 Tax=Chromera velia CCMP2878 TaxID=1169474 RepID=A0A0G4FFQ3_9ALVE|eukprot:Cvel_16731.t1-p1 / transcript=Cvel_16731.t1 / gene=Cvel_16731 / organism=Chromera_velia_CCMP2878 / gene_product=Probable U3 small nucleolar RNA-associated protein, putative / transcript_product=Probable U3 small nucleolar RNA-associated protein, putative / location=Cvel_scaffold1301:29311-36616(-) / protein_length=574 / sequence_SO=supercontig / SO=protein_coding / is_pseudo=false
MPSKKEAGSAVKAEAGTSSQSSSAMPKKEGKARLPLSQKEQRQMARVKQLQKLQDEADKRLKDNEVLLTTEPGFLEPEHEMGRTYKVRQADLKQQVDVGTAQKAFSLSLPFGPYVHDFSRDGRFLCFGGRKGHLSLLDLGTMNSRFEVQLEETIRDVKVLQSHEMVATAQKKYAYIYDSQGIELHRIKEAQNPLKLEYLPFHFLLCSIGDSGRLRWQDITSGKVAADHRTNYGPCEVMRQNMRNAVLHLGHNNGRVTLWTPNMSRPVAEVVAQRGKVLGLDVWRDYLATTGTDGLWKVWDLRKFQVVTSHAWTPLPPTDLSFSQTGLLAMTCGPVVQVFRDTTQKGGNPESQGAVALPYLAHSETSERFERVRFRPHEDFAMVGGTQGIYSVIVPGAGSPNIDAFANNPFQSKKQRREAEVRALLDKLPADTISFEVARIGGVEALPKAIREDIAKEREQEAEARQKSKKTVKKMRGRSKSGAREKLRSRQQAEEMRDRTRDRLSGKDVEGEEREEAEEVYFDGEGGGGEEEGEGGARGKKGKKVKKETGDSKGLSGKKGIFDRFKKGTRAVYT